MSHDGYVTLGEHFYVLRKDKNNFENKKEINNKKNIIFNDTGACNTSIYIYWCNFM